jgi:type I restriction enzyme S subunit
MKNAGKKPKLPRLRFPEFRDGPGWEEVALGDIAEIKLGKMLDSQKHTTGRLLPYLNNASVRWNEVNTSNLPQMYFEDEELDRFGLIAGDVVVCEGGEPGRAAVWDGRLPDLKFQKAIHRVRFNGPFEPRLLVLYLESVANTTQFQMLFTGGGIRHLTRETFAKLNIPVGSPPEQQRIAACLAALDELIGAESQKLDALKAHKKGLMQHLFPRAGETVPRLRFPEFRDAPDWEPTKLSSAIDLISGMHLSPEQYCRSGEMPYFTGPSDFTNNVRNVTRWTNQSESVAQENDTLITVKGSGVGEIWYLTLPSVAMGRQLMAVRAKHSASRFIFQLLLGKRTRFEDLASGNLIPGLSRPDILDLEALIPSLPEQRVIASCLWSVDNLIAAQCDKVEALKSHKRGLMQGLFPSAGD